MHLPFGSGFVFFQSELADYSALVSTDTSVDLASNVLFIYSVRLFKFGGQRLRPAHGAAG